MLLHPTRAVSNEDPEKRIEMFLVEYFGALLPKKDLATVTRNLAVASDEKDSPIRNITFRNLR